MASSTLLNNPIQAAAESDSAAELRRIFATLLDSWRLILLILAISTLIGLYFAWTPPNVYRSEALIEIEGKTSGYALAEVGDAAGFENKNSIELSRQVMVANRNLTRSLDEGDFEVLARPMYFRTVGAAWARKYGVGKLVEAPRLAKMLVPHYKQYAWGGEDIRVDTFVVPEGRQGIDFVVEAGVDGAYKLYQGGRFLGDGKVKQLLNLSQDVDHPFRLMITALLGHPGAQFSLKRLSRREAVLLLRANLRLNERALHTGLMSVNGFGDTPQIAADRANAVSRAYVRSNVERLSEEADKRLTFLSEQLPKLKIQLDTAENALANYRSNSQSSALSDQSANLVSTMSSIESQLSDIELQRADLASVFTAAHPSIVALDRRKAELQAKQGDLNRKVASLPAEEARLVQFTRDAKVSDALYTLLLNKSQELKIAKAGTVGSMHIVDDAIPEAVPVQPARFNLLMRYVLGGLILAIAVVLGRRQFSGTVERAEDLEQRLGVAPHASIPFSKDQADIEKGIKAGALSSTKLLCHTHPNDPAVESFRSLRTSAYFALMEKQSNVIAITGAMPMVGKTFSAANLAGVFADTGRRTLIIDCDLRKGRLQSSLGIKSRTPGLSDVLVDDATIEQAVRSTYQTDLFVLTSGKLPPNPSELLGSHRFSELLNQLKKEYDFVILDCPPVMNLADAVLVTQHAGAVYMIVRAKQTTFAELSTSLRRLKYAGVTANGFVFNGFTVDFASYLRGGSDYTYYRSSDQHYNRDAVKS